MAEEEKNQKKGESYRIQKRLHGARPGYAFRCAIVIKKRRKSKRTDIAHHGGQKTRKRFGKGRRS